MKRRGFGVLHFIAEYSRPMKEV